MIIILSAMPPVHIPASFRPSVVHIPSLVPQPQCSVRATLGGGTAEGLPGACDRGVCWIKYTMEGIPLSAISIFNNLASLQAVVLNQS